MTYTQTDTVSALIREAAASVIMPAYQPGRVIPQETKGDGSPVTVADRAAEKLIRKCLKNLTGAPVLGEEYASKRGMTTQDAQAWSSERAFKGKPFWTVDPIDGTRQFAQGKPSFATMVSEVEAGAVSRAWIYLPASQEMFVLDQGKVTLNGVQMMQLDAARQPCIGVSYVPQANQNYVVSGGSNSGAIAGRGSGSVGVDYTLLMRGVVDFVAHREPKPWDHLPGTAMIVALGGRSETTDDSIYDPSYFGPGKILTASHYAWPTAAHLVYDKGIISSTPTWVAHPCICRVSLRELNPTCPLHSS